MVYPVKAVGILKQHGRSFKDSQLFHGYVMYGGRAGQGMPRTVKNAKIALLDIDLRKSKMSMGVQVVVTDPTQLEAIRQRESDITKERINLLLAAGANVILTTKGIDDMAIKYFVEAGALAVRRVKKEDLRRVAKLTGGTLMITFADMEGNESFDPVRSRSARHVAAFPAAVPTAFPTASSPHPSHETPHLPSQPPHGRPRVAAPPHPPAPACAVVPRHCGRGHRGAHRRR